MVKYKSPYKSSNGYKSPYKSSRGYTSPYKSGGFNVSENTRIDSLEDFEKIAEAYGYEKKKPSLFKRIFEGTKNGLMWMLDFTQRANYAVAGAAREVVTGGSDVVGEFWKGITGEERDVFSDVLGDAGVKNKWVKNIGGFVLDVALDPVNWLSGAGIMRKAGKAGKYLTKAGKIAKKHADDAIAKVYKRLAPEITKGGDIGMKALKQLQKKTKRIGFALDDILEKAPNKYYKGVTMFGKELIPRKYAVGLTKGVFGAPNKIAKKVLPKKIYNKTVKKLVVTGKKAKEGLLNAFSIYGTRKAKRAKGLVDDIFTNNNMKSKLFDKSTNFWREMWHKNGLTDGENKRIVNAFMKKKREYIEEVWKKRDKVKKLLKKSLKDTNIPKFQADDVGKVIEEYTSTPKKLDDFLGLVEKNRRIRTEFTVDKIDDITKKIHSKELREDEGMTILKRLIQDLKVGDDVEKEILENLSKDEKKLQKLITKGFAKTKKNKEFLDLQDELREVLEKRVSKFGKEAGEKATKSGKKFVASEGEVLELDTLLKEYRQQFIDIQEKAGQQESLISSLFDIRRQARVKINNTDLDYDLIADSSDRVTNIKKFFKDELSPEIDRLSKAAGYTEDPLKYYIPSIKKGELGDFFKTTVPKGFRETSLGIYKGAIGDDELLKKPFKLYSLKERQIIANQMNRQAIKDFVEVYGRKTSLYDDAVSKLDGKELEEYQKAWKAVRLSDSDEIIGYLNKQDEELVRGIFNPELNIIDKLSRALKYDAFTNTFKKWVTSYFPAFHVRNSISGFIQNFQVLGAKVFNPMRLNESMAVMTSKADDVGRKVFKSKHLTASYKQLREVLTDKFFRSSRFFSDFTGKTKDLIKFRNPDLGRAAGDFIETHQKAHAMVTALKDGRTLNEALDLAEKAGFDYGKMTKFEESFMKRMIPFYAFARKNAALQINTAIKNPGRILSQMKFTRMLSGVFGGKLTEKDLKGIPPWARDALGFRVSNGVVLSNFDVPVKEFLSRVAEPGKTTMSSLNPLIKYPTEALSGFDFFRGEQIVEVDKIAPVLGKLIESKHTPGPIKDLFNITTYTDDRDGKEKTVYKADPYALHALRSIPLARMQGTISRVFDEDESLIEKALSFLTGAKLYDIDQEKQQYFKDRDAMDELRQYVDRNGIGYTYESLLINKEDLREATQKQQKER